MIAPPQIGTDRYHRETLASLDLATIRDQGGRGRKVGESQARD